jgi:hypothetical protein
MVSQLSQFDGQEREDAFPFATENPSGVPGITEIEGRVIAAIAGHVAEGIEGVVNINQRSCYLHRIPGPVRKGEG